MTVDEKLVLIEDMLELDKGELKGTMKLTDVENWDSMAKLSLMVLVDEECGKKLTGEQIKKFVIVQDILDFME